MLEKFKYLVERGLIRPPGGSIPPVSAFANEAAWNAYVWHVPAKRLHSRKLTWAEIGNGEAFVRAARAECRRRIMVNYNADSIEDEILKRLRGERTYPQDWERDRLLAKYRELIGGRLPYTEEFEPSMLDE